MKNAFYFMLEALFIPKTLKYLSSLFGYVEKRLNEKAKVNFKIYDVTNWQQITAIHILSSISRNKSNQRMKLWSVNRI